MTTTLSPTLADLLARRLKRPQRHRLLQGFPSAPLMGLAVPPSLPVDQSAFGHVDIPFRRLDGSIEDDRVKHARSWLLTQGTSAPDPDITPPAATTMGPATAPPEPPVWHTEYKARMLVQVEEPSLAAGPVVSINGARKLIVGVIPHTQCTPRKEGCGFCTFPHDKANPELRKATTESVAREIDHVLAREYEHTRDRSVDAVYFGGGTANLASTDELTQLFTALVDGGLNLSNAELSLEGVPALFMSFLNAPLKTLERLKVRRRRISMGVQTFDPSFIAQMGREAFGDHALIERVIKRSRSMNIGVSGDFLFNMPGQTLAQMRADVDKATALGFDQICLYNLVLYRGLGTLWSQDEALVAAMPDNDVACANWLTLRRQLLEAGYIQTTVTNFERADLPSADRFQYEVLGFSPETTDLLGFGPMSISLFCDFPKQAAVKLLRRKDLRQPPWSGQDLAHVYGPGDLRLLVVTRGMARLGLERDVYQQLFTTDVVNDFPEATRLLLQAGLIDVDEAEVCLTPRGMFFSDTVVSVFAAEVGLATPGALGLHTATLLQEPVMPGEHFAGMG